MNASHGNIANGTHSPRDFKLGDRSPAVNEQVSLASPSSSSSLDKQVNRFIYEADDVRVARTSPSETAAPNHFNPFRDDTNVPTSMPVFSPAHENGSDLPTSTFPTTPSSSDTPDSVPKMDVTAIRSPAVQIMERTSEASPYRIPDYVFQRNKSRTPKEWSTASNESLFSIQGHMSFTGDLFYYNKSGELGMRKSEDLGMLGKSGELDTQKSYKSGEFSSYTSSGELGYSKSIDLGWYNLSGELPTHRRTMSGSGQIVNSPGVSQPQANASNSMGTNNPIPSQGLHGGEQLNLSPSVGATNAAAAEPMRDCTRENEKNHNLVGLPSLAIGCNSPRTDSYLDDRTSSTKSFTFPVLMKPDKTPSSLTQSSIPATIHQQDPSQQPRTPPAATNTLSATNTNTQTQNKSSFFSCFSCCPLRS